MTGRAVLNSLADQIGGHMVRARDGTHYLRLHGRYGARPTGQRITRAFSWLREVRGVPKIEPFGDSWVKNVITVKYQLEAPGQYRRRAWVHGNASDDGYGVRSSAAEAASAQSITDYGRGRLTQDCPFIQAPKTAMGHLEWLLSRRAAPPTRIQFAAAPACIEWLPGDLIHFDATLDDIILFNGTSWVGKWFEIEDIRTAGTGFTVRALSVPTVEIAQYAMGPNIMVEP